MAELVNSVEGFEETINENNGAVFAFMWRDEELNSPATAEASRDFYARWFRTGYYFDGPPPSAIQDEVPAVVNLRTGVLMGKSPADEPLTGSKILRLVQEADQDTADAGPDAN